MNIKKECLPETSEYSKLLVSVIIAVYNGSSTLQAAIDSITAQTYTNKELIIVDGNSTDGTVNLIKVNHEKIDYWISEADTGIYNAWNKALKVAKGDYVCFLGADDCYAEDTSLNEMMSLITNTKELPDLISAKVAMIDNNGIRHAEVGKPWNWSELKRQHRLAHTGMLHHNSIFLKCGQYNESYRISSDYDLVLRLGKNAITKHLNKATVLMGDEGISNTQTSVMLNEFRLIQSNHIDIGFFRAYLNFLTTNIKIEILKVRDVLGIKSLKFWKKY